jgi:hypothetical protein
LKNSADNWTGEQMYLDDFIRKMEEFGVHFNRVAVRLMFSPISNVLSIHYINLNPYNQEKRATDKEIGEISQMRRKPEQILNGISISNFDTDHLGRQAVYLNRNL